MFDDFQQECKNWRLMQRLQAESLLQAVRCLLVQARSLRRKRTQVRRLLHPRRRRLLKRGPPSVVCQRCFPSSTQRPPHRLELQPQLRLGPHARLRNASERS